MGVKRGYAAACLATFALFAISPSATARADTTNLPESLLPQFSPSLEDGVLQCVPYARQLSGIRIFGDAWTWWDQADGVYARGSRPGEGAVLALRATQAMPLGHVATVSRVLGPREILLDHANWSGPGLIEHDVPAVDISPDNDWSQVRVWWGQGGRLGARSNPAYGFIYPRRAAGPGRRLVLSDMPHGEAEKGARIRPGKAERRLLLAYADISRNDGGPDADSDTGKRTLAGIIADVKREARLR